MLLFIQERKEFNEFESQRKKEKWNAVRMMRDIAMFIQL